MQRELASFWDTYLTRLLPKRPTHSVRLKSHKVWGAVNSIEQIHEDMVGVTCLQEAQSFVCRSHLLSSWSLLSLGGSCAEVAPFAQPTSPPAFSCSHTLKAATALHIRQTHRLTSSCL